MSTPAELRAAEIARHASRRFGWQKDLLASEVKQIGKIVGFALSAHVNDERGDFEVWPSQRVLGTECGETDRNVRRGLKELVDTRYLEIVDGAGGGGRGRTTHYILSFPTDDKPGRIAPGIDDNNPDNLGPIPGQIGSDTRTNCADELTKKLTKELNKETKKADDGERIKTPEPERLPDIDYSNLSGAEQLPEGLVRQARDETTAWRYASKSAVEFLGYKFGDKPNGKQPDEFVMAFIPPAALAELSRRCRAGTLTHATVAAAMLALRVPQERRAPADLGQSLDHQGATQ